MFYDVTPCDFNKTEDGALDVHAFPDELADQIPLPAGSVRMRPEEYAEWVAVNHKPLYDTWKAAKEKAEADKLPTIEDVRAQIVDLSATLDKLEAKAAPIVADSAPAIIP